MPKEDREIPMMFQAQIEGRGKIQYAGNPKPAEKWVKEWIDGCPIINQAPTQDDVPVWKRRPTPPPALKLPQFGGANKIWQYSIRWRMVTNGGRDESIIRPVIGAKGLPFFPGSSVKGAFLRVCPSEKKKVYYCGGEIILADGQKLKIPGVLRFHGGYPIDMQWAADQARLVDIIHNQQKKQLMDASTSSAKVQISLYKPTYQFGFSSTKHLSGKEWNEVKEIWEKALSRGIGLRTSAGYGYVDGVNYSNRILTSLHLRGQGLSSVLLTKKILEFRPNMFKAVLRGHTLRILGGITNEDTAKKLTKILWGGIQDADSGTVSVGKVAIEFKEQTPINLSKHTYTNTNDKRIIMPTFLLKRGELNLLKVGLLSGEQSIFLHHLLQFAMLLGGFSKSWRRVSHDLFYRDYLSGKKPMIGCHWEFTKQSHDQYIPVSDSMSEITEFLNATHAAVTDLLVAEGYLLCVGQISPWREAFHPSNVQVWGRLAQNEDDSLAVRRLHDSRLKGKPLTGGLGRAGRVWHRMYPRFEGSDSNTLKRVKSQFIELLTIFPLCDNSTQQQIQFLTDGFTRLWGE
jgi:CRISPR-associated protein Cmr6